MISDLELDSIIRAAYWDYVSHDSQCPFNDCFTEDATDSVITICNTAINSNTDTDSDYINNCIMDCIKERAEKEILLTQARFEAMDV